MGEYEIEKCFNGKVDFCIYQKILRIYLQLSSESQPYNLLIYFIFNFDIV